MRLNDALTQFTSLFLAWGDFLVNPNFVRRDNVVTWNGEHEYWPEELTFDDLARAEETKQYTFQVDDGSIFQMYYVFADDGITVSTAGLGFLHSKPYSQTDAAGLVPWVRCDYAPLEADGPCHDCCHLHLSVSKNVRIPVRRLPSPAQFVEMIAAWFYPDRWREKWGTTRQDPWLTAKDARAVHVPAMQPSHASVLADYVHIFVP